MAELTDEQIEAAAKVLARYSDTPWAMLPETSKMKARTVAGEIIRAALSTLPSATGAEDAEMRKKAARYDWLRNDATHREQDSWLMRLPENADDFADKKIAARTQPNGGEISQEHS